MGSLVAVAEADLNDIHSNSSAASTGDVVHHEVISYSESGLLATDLARLMGTSDGYLDSVHSLRDNVGADVVVLVVDTGDGCGLAGSIGATASNAFAVVKKSCIVSKYSVAHELGHLAGARHELASDNTDDPYPYGHGYVRKTVPTFETIMSIDGVGRIKHWSSDMVTYQGVATGSETHENVALVWDQQTATLAGFRDPPPPPQGITLQVLISGPFELGWHESAILSTYAFLDDPEDENGGPCTNCTYKWYERPPGGSWYYTGITTTSYYTTMLWTEGREYRVDATDGTLQASDTHFIDYCSSPCGPPAKRGDAAGDADAIVDLYPNPSRSTATLRFVTSSTGKVVIRVVDLLGRVVRLTPYESRLAGDHSVDVDLNGLVPGVYQVVVATEQTQLARTLVRY